MKHGMLYTVNVHNNSKKEIALCSYHLLFANLATAKTMETEKLGGAYCNDLFLQNTPEFHIIAFHILYLTSHSTFERSNFHVLGCQVFLFASSSFVVGIIAFFYTFPPSTSPPLQWFAIHAKRII